MLAIRFLRTGRRHHPSYKIVVVDKKRAPKSGKFIEQLGFSNPLTKENSIKKERTLYWISKGAQPSNTVHNFLVQKEIIQDKKISVHNKPKKKAEEKPAEEKPAEEKPAEEKPAEEKPAEEKPAEEKPAEEKPKETLEGDKEKAEKKTEVEKEEKN